VQKQFKMLFGDFLVALDAIPIGAVFDTLQGGIDLPVFP
jgi:hypothetical protein